MIAKFWPFTEGGRSIFRTESVAWRIPPFEASTSGFIMITFREASTGRGAGSQPAEPRLVSAFQSEVLSAGSFFRKLASGSGADAYVRAGCPHPAHELQRKAGRHFSSGVNEIPLMRVSFRKSERQAEFVSQKPNRRCA